MQAGLAILKESRDECGNLHLCVATSFHVCSVMYKSIQDNSLIARKHFMSPPEVVQHMVIRMCQHEEHIKNMDDKENIRVESFTIRDHTLPLAHKGSCLHQ